MQKWQNALEDALQCVSKDSNFIKGYFRLAIAQSELGFYDDAETTLRAVLAKEPENDQAMRQIRAVRTKKAGALAAMKKPIKKEMDEQQMKEFFELQEQTNGYSRDLRGVQLRVG
jgi:tetratricopeptide (TPR) repeat protein